ncbi:hypothetical protein LOTGIDRAFT_233787 [Lottia gigantea]|uniref:Dolichol-phosphate mannosyltransferase subunit 3 n=1 Tax=Lottia gigantea TaxID=225164 RepID=V4AB78_LOTGI|nr:hypothetical protein LOTGIDRAFT_233787 [Lottia gigantea]ESO90556.1 hypothetical protein LOTGIDRAFT_233787 [Lottia gigantea]
MIAKLYQWLIAGSILLSIWLALLVDYVQSDMISQNKYTIFMIPIYLAVAFAVYSAAVVGYRVATFNNCDEAAVELQQQIKEAREDLKKKGFVFTER